MNRTKRSAAICSGLAAIGGVVGGLCAFAALTTLIWIREGSQTVGSRDLPRIFQVTLGFGVVTGVVAAPLLGFGLLRHVRLGRAIAVTAFGCVAGAIIGELVRPARTHPTEVPSVLSGALLGFLVAGVALRHRNPTVPSDERGH